MKVNDSYFNSSLHDLVEIIKVLKKDNIEVAKKLMKIRQDLIMSVEEEDYNGNNGIS